MKIISTLLFLIISVNGSSQTSLIVEMEAKMRVEKNPLSEVLYTISQGTTVKVISHEEGYYKVDYRGKIGYINDVFFIKKRGTSTLSSNIASGSYSSVGKISGQDFNVEQTIKYLNDRFKEYPYISQSGDYIYTYIFKVTSSGELEIIESQYRYQEYMKNKHFAKAIIVQTSRIDFEMIDVHESFYRKRYYDSESSIYLFPVYGGSFFRQVFYSYSNIIDKKTLPYDSRGVLGGSVRNRISIYTGDIGNKHQIINALQHLTELVLSEPEKYNKIRDPFDYKRF